MRITDYLQKECIKVILEGNTKEEIILELLDLIIQNHPEIDEKDARKGLLERENLESTAIGDGIAIPHTKIEKGQDIFAALGLLHKDVKFNSLDNEPVKLVFLILYPKAKINLQLRFLARVSRLLQHSNLQVSLFECKTLDDVLDTFRHYEDKHFH
jgi:mannitol/fructose-specific phosphotransferase system IIA component (Ntr-type)